MNNKGVTFMDGVVGILIVSLMLLLLSNYRSFVIDADRKLDAALEFQIQASNIIEYVYSCEDWSALDLTGWQDLSAEYTYLGVISNYDVERISLRITSGLSVKEFILEKSSFSPN